jgi:septal ring factor EnvC (AmiA/AmiB activator)
MDTLKELIQMGFSPIVALVIVAVIVLWGSLCGVVVFMYRSQLNERKATSSASEERDKLRAAWHAEVEERLDESEQKHKQCEDDRTELRNELGEVKHDLDRIKRCPKSDCPMRLPS